jgi:hypothetical protein
MKWGVLRKQRRGQVLASLFGERAVKEESARCGLSMSDRLPARSIRERFCCIAAPHARLAMRRRVFSMNHHE